MAKPVHFLWHAFVALTQERRQTAQEALDTLLEIWPSYPVAELVKAEGNEARALELLQAQRQASQGSGDAQGGPPSGTEDMNTLIRAKAGRGRPPTAETVPPAEEDFIRARFTAKYGPRQGQG